MKASITMSSTETRRRTGVAVSKVKLNVTTWAGLIVVAVLVIGAVFAPQLAPYSPAKQNILDQLAPPGAEYLLGADQYGRDTLSRILFGARYSLIIGFFAVVLAMIIGTIIGMIAGFKGGRIDTVLTQIMDVVLAFPALILGIALVALMGPTITNIISAIAFTSVPAFARVARSAVITQRDREYVQACQAMGFSQTRILLRHILPAILPEIMVIASLWTANAVRTEASLAFIGLGIAPPAPTWGGMVRDGFENILSSPYPALIPSLAILLLVLAFNLIGDGLRDLIDPRMKDAS